MDFLTPLSVDLDRLVEVSADNLDAKVPTCPEWSVDDLVRHVAEVYLHKVACMRLNAAPSPWPLDLSGEATLPLLARAYGELTDEFAARAPQLPAHTWHDPDQTVGFWVRRMAQETVIHRIDAELAAGVPSRTVPDDLALDGIDELLDIFLAWSSVKWHDEFAAALSTSDGRRVAVVAAGERWLITPGPDGVVVTRGDELADAEVRGSPDAVLRWLWRRADDSIVTIGGDLALVARLHELLGLATQ